MLRSRVVLPVVSVYNAWQAEGLPPFFNHGDEDTRSALVAVSGDDAVRVILTADKQFVLEPVRAKDAARALIGALPEVPPGRGPVISLPGDALREKPKHRAENDGGGFLQPNRLPTTPHQQQVDALRKLLAEPRLGGGQLFVGRRDRFGRRVRGPKPLTYFDTTGGRYLQFRTPGTNGEPWNTVQPADFTTMAARLGLLVSTLPGG